MEISKERLETCLGELMGSYYNITTVYENAIYERGEDNYYAIKIKNVAGNTNVDPSTVSLTITNECGHTFLEASDFVKDATGEYHYIIDLPDNAMFGQYNIAVEASSPSINTIYKDKFYILPWNIIYDVRRYSGITSKKSITDHDIAGIIWESYLKVLDEVYEDWQNETPNCNPDTGEWFNGTNTEFETKHSPIADGNGDGEVTGWGETSCGSDVTGYFKDENGDCHKLKITVNEPYCGNITITQLDGTAVPSSAEWVHIKYKSEWTTFDKGLFKNAVAFLAAHECIVRFKELDKATMADLHSNKTVILDDRDRMMKAYKNIMDRIKRPDIGAGMLPGE